MELGGYFSGEEVLKSKVCWIDPDLGARSTVGVSLVEVFKHDMCGELTLQEKHGTKCGEKTYCADRLKATQIKSLTQTAVTLSYLILSHRPPHPRKGLA